MNKTFDIGNGIISASIGMNGKAVTISRAHCKHGYILFTPIQKFDNNKWYDREAVRNYRNFVLKNEIQEKGYSLDFDFQNSMLSSPLKYYENANVIHSKNTYQNIDLETFFFVPPSCSFLVILYEVKNNSDYSLISDFILSGEFGIIRAAYGQITENGPIPLPETENQFTLKPPLSFNIHEKGTSSNASVNIIGNFNAPANKGASFSSKLPAKVNFHGNLHFGAGQKHSIALVISLEEENFTFKNNLSLQNIYLEFKRTVTFWQNLYVALENKSFEYIVNRNFAYTYGCCCISGYGAMITDHQSLPLTWNRDNYYMYKLIESFYRINKSPELLSTMINHIKWLFEFMSDQGWGRSHLINGQIKDRIFQFDQQCYPILEVFDFLSFCSHDDLNLSDIFVKLDNLSNIILSHKGEEAVLFRTEENPADDPVLFPYHFSTQILAWKTFDALHKMNLKYSFSSKNYEQIRDLIRADVFKFMISEHHGEKMFCYTTDLQGNYEFYNDANDLPFAFAALWGFIDVRDDIFMNSFKWSFSKNNKGFYEGAFGGLGSEHAKGHWPLGDSQLLAIALAQINAKEKNGEILWDTALEMIEAIAQKDGLFSESVFPDSGKVFTRYYFAWPGAVISWLYLIRNKLNGKI